MRVVVIVTLAVVAGCAGRPYPCARPYTPSVAAGGPFLWEVTGDRGAITLFGTYQSASGDDVPDAAWTALTRAEVFVAEVDEVPEHEHESRFIQGFMVLPPGVYLDDLLGHDTFDRLADELDIPRARLRHLKPWVAMIRLAQTAYDLPSQNISAALLERARDDGLRTEFLDTIYQQVRFLDASAGTIKLKHALANRSSMSCTMTRRVEAYRAGDDLYFTSDVPDAGDPIVPRIERWSRSIEGYLVEGRRAFVAIGTSNLLGPYGLLVRLQARGYRVRRLSP